MPSLNIRNKDKEGTLRKKYKRTVDLTHPWHLIYPSQSQFEILSRASVPFYHSVEQFDVN